jgi:hypothetical protein
VDKPPRRLPLLGRGHSASANSSGGEQSPHAPADSIDLGAAAGASGAGGGTFPKGTPFASAAMHSAPGTPHGGSSSASLATSRAGSGVPSGYPSAGLARGASGGGGGGAIRLDDQDAAYALVVTDDCLRLYTAEKAARGDRGSLRRVAVPGRLRFAAAFSAGGAPAVAALLQDGDEDRMQVGDRASGI